MMNEKVTRTWGGAAAIIAAVVCIAAAALWVATAAKAQAGQDSCPPITIQWQPQSVLESKFMAKVLEDNKNVLNGLQAFAKNPNLTVDDMKKYVDGTYLRTPRFWAKEGWVEGWANVLAKLKEIFTRDSHPVITSVAVLIEYQAYTGARAVEQDIDALAKVRITFAASPDGNILEGTLRHSRVCVIEP